MTADTTTEVGVLALAAAAAGLPGAKASAPSTAVDDESLDSSAHPGSDRPQHGSAPRRRRPGRVARDRLRNGSRCSLSTRPHSPSRWCWNAPCSRCPAAWPMRPSPTESSRAPPSPTSTTPTRVSAPSATSTCWCTPTTSSASARCWAVNGSNHRPAPASTAASGSRRPTGSPTVTRSTCTAPSCSARTGSACTCPTSGTTVRTSASAGGRSPRSPPRPGCMHTCYACVLSDYPPRAHPRRDLAEMVLFGDHDVPRIIDMARRWRAEAVARHGRRRDLGALRPGRHHGLDRLGLELSREHQGPAAAHACIGAPTLPTPGWPCSRCRSSTGGGRAGSSHAASPSPTRSSCATAGCRCPATCGEAAVAPYGAVPGDRRARATRGPAARPGRRTGRDRGLRGLADVAAPARHLRPVGGPHHRAGPRPGLAAAALARRPRRRPALVLRARHHGAHRQAAGLARPLLGRLRLLRRGRRRRGIRRSRPSARRALPARHLRRPARPRRGGHPFHPAGHRSDLRDHRTVAHGRLPRLLLAGVLGPRCCPTWPSAPPSPRATTDATRS